MPRDNCREIRISGRTPLWIGAGMLLCQRGDDFRRHLALVRQGFAPEAVHDLRVSSRRLREGLLLFAPCYPAQTVSHLARRIRKVTRLLGEIRNRDEAILFFRGLRDELSPECSSGITSLVAGFEEERASEMKMLARGLGKSTKAISRQIRQLADTPALFMTEPEAGDPFAPLEEFGRTALRSRLEPLLQLAPAARLEGNITEQHRFRIAVKHVRYRLEILSFLFSENYAACHAVLKGYQELLGTLHDLDVFSAIVRDASLPHPGSAEVLDAIAAQRGRLFKAYSAMLVTHPPEEFGSCLGLY